MSANPGACLQIESENQQPPVAKGVASAAEVKHQEARIRKPQAGYGKTGNRCNHAVPALAPTTSCTLVCITVSTSPEMEWTCLTLECRASLHYISRSISLCGVRGRSCGALSSSLHVCDCNACPKMLGSLYKVWVGNVLQSHQKLLETNTQVHARTHAHPHNKHGTYMIVSGTAKLLKPGSLDPNRASVMVIADGVLFHN